MKQLINFLRIPKKYFQKNGILLISPGASTLNFYKIIYEKLYLPLEIRALYFFSIFKKKFQIIKFHHGYIYSSQDIIEVANKNNFTKCKKIFKGDFLSEFNRSMIISKLIKKKIYSFKNFYFYCKKILL